MESLMYQSNVGLFDGGSWERLCQSVFKMRFAADGYQPIPPSPGDFGLEGFCKLSGMAFQCYCPEKNYSQKDLHRHQVNKITTDLKKLRDYEDQLLRRVGATKITRWCFVTPDIAHNDLLEHAEKKQEEAKAWNLSLLHKDFKVLLHDADFYKVEIQALNHAQGLPLMLGSQNPSLPASTAPQEVYDDNILRKSKARLSLKSHIPSYAQNVQALSSITTRDFLEADQFYRKLAHDAPNVYHRVAGLIEEYSYRVAEESLTWMGTPEELTGKVREELYQYLISLGNEIGTTNAQTLARVTVARWLAVCTLDYTG
jgi:hypothetical protein